MPNFAVAFKDETIRLAKKEVRRETEAGKKAASQFRTDIAKLKLQVAVLEKLVARLDGAAKKAKAEAGAADSAEPTRFRFSAKRLAAQRQKQGLSATGMGVLLSVSAQTIYNWEAGKSRPRPQQLAALAAVREMGKREIAARLADEPTPTAR